MAEASQAGLCFQVASCKKLSNEDCGFEVFDPDDQDRGKMVGGVFDAPMAYKFRVTRCFVHLDGVGAVWLVTP